MGRQFALLVVAALLPLVVVSALLETVSATDWQASMRRQALDHAEAVATLVSRELAADERSAQMIAQSPGFDDGLDESRIGKLAVRLVQNEPLWRAISVTDRAGVRLLDQPYALAGVAHGKAVDLSSQQAVVASGRPGVGNVVVGRRGGAAFAVRAPVIRAGRVDYVVSIIVEPRNLRDLLLAGGLPHGWPVRLADDRGLVVAASDVTGGFRLSVPELALSRHAVDGVFYPAARPHGGHDTVTWRTVPGTSWKVEVAIPPAAYHAPIVRAVERVSTAIAAAIVLIVLFAWLLARELERERARQAAVLEGQRLEILGRMTGGVAHDFNNLLTPIIGGLELLQRRVDGNPAALRLIDASLQSAERAKALVGRLLVFARKQTLESRDVDVAGLIGGLADLLQRSIPAEIDLRLDIAEDLPSARVDPIQLELAIFNLALNARDAMAGGGVLTIGASMESVTETRSSDLKSGRYVQISVQDTGVGMSAATLKAAIEPFFTTKAIGSGTGLGLSMVHGLAAQSNGALRLFSEPGVGTTAEIWLPEGAATPPAEAMREPEIGTATGRLLLVDDDDLVRASTAAVLKEQGHEVIDVASGKEALVLLRAGERFDLLVTDFVMPQMSGAELIRETRGLRPGLPVLMITGYADPGAEMPKDIGLLAKPFRSLELLGRVARILAADQTVAA